MLRTLRTLKIIPKDAIMNILNGMPNIQAWKYTDTLTKLH